MVKLLKYNYSKLQMLEAFLDVRNLHSEPNLFRSCFLERSLKILRTLGILAKVLGNSRVPQLHLENH